MGTAVGVEKDDTEETTKKIMRTPAVWGGRRYEAGDGDRLKWFGRVDWRTAPRARLLFAILIPYDIEREQS